MTFLKPSCKSNLHNFIDIAGVYFFCIPMHEFSIVSSMFDILMKIAEENRLIKIEQVTLSVGKMRQIVPLAMETAFAAVAKDTIAEGAKLVLEYIPIKMRCATCGEEFDVNASIYVCPKCGSSRLELLQGQELIIKNIEGEN